MRKNIIKIGTMALTASMMLTPASNVFAARESQKTVEVVDSTNHDEQSGGNAESEIEAQGILTTAYIVTADVLNVRSGGNYIFKDWNSC